MPLLSKKTDNKDEFEKMIFLNYSFVNKRMLKVFSVMKKGKFVNVGSPKKIQTMQTLCLENAKMWNGIHIDYDANNLMELEMLSKAYLIHERIATSNSPDYGKGFVIAQRKKTLTSILEELARMPETQFKGEYNLLNLYAKNHLSILGGVDFSKFYFDCISMNSEPNSHTKLFLIDRGFIPVDKSIYLSQYFYATMNL